MIGFGVIIGLIALVYVIRRAFSRETGELGGWETAGARQIISAVARTTLSEGLRTRIASGFVILTLASVPFFYLTAEGDGTVKGRIQMFMTYSLGFSGFMLSLLSILFACRSLSHEIAGRQIFAIVSKPVPRWQVVVGKYVGIMLLNAMILAAVGVGTYAGTQALVSRFKSQLRAELIADGALTPEQADAAVASLEKVRGEGKEGVDSPVITAMSQATGRSHSEIVDVLLRLPEGTRVDLRRFDEIRRQVLISRASIKPKVPDKEIKAEVDRRFQLMKEEGHLPMNMTERQIREELDKQIFSRYCTIAPYESRFWLLQGPPPKKGEDRIMSIRFKMQVLSVIPAIDHPETGQKLEEDSLLSIWGIGNPTKASFYEYVDAVPARTVQELEFPIEAVEPDGTIRVEFANLDPRRVDVIFDLNKNALEVLYVVGTFEQNLFIGCLAMLIPLSCLTAFGVCASTFLSFPVGALFVICLFMISASMGFIHEAMAITEDYMPENPGLDIQFRKKVVQSIGWLLSIGDIPVTDNLMEGRAIGWDRLWQDGWRFLLLKTGATIFVAVLVFRRRELASIVV